MDARQAESCPGHETGAYRAEIGRLVALAREQEAKLLKRWIGSERGSLAIGRKLRELNAEIERLYECRHAAEQRDRSPEEWAARLGFAFDGVVHLRSSRPCC